MASEDHPAANCNPGQLVSELSWVVHGKLGACNLTHPKLHESANGECEC